MPDKDLLKRLQEAAKEKQATNVDNQESPANEMVQPEQAADGNESLINRLQKAANQQHNNNVSRGTSPSGNYEKDIYDTVKEQGYSDKVANMIVAQAKHESGNFTSHVFKSSGNPFGMTYSPKDKTAHHSSVHQPKSEEGLEYSGYDDVREATVGVLGWLQRREREGKLKIEEAADSPSSYARALKRSRYYTAPEQEYSTALMRHYNPAPKSIQPAAKGVNPEIVNKDLKQATDFFNDYLLPKNNIDAPANNSMSKDWKGFPYASAKPVGNIDQAKQAAMNEINAAKDYVGTFYQQNPELNKYMSAGGFGQGQGDIDPNSGLNRVINPTGDVPALAQFSGTALSLLADKKKKDLAALERLYPMVGGSVSKTNDFALPAARENEADYDKGVAEINKRYQEQSDNLRNSISSIGHLKVANTFLKEHGTTKEITPKEAQEIGWDYMEAVGDGATAQKQRLLAAKNMLTPQEKVEAQRLGYRTMQFKMMDAAANGETAVSDHLSKSVAGYAQKIRQANPEAVRENLINAVSDAVNENDKTNIFLKPIGRAGFSPSRETMIEAAQKIGLTEADLQGINPEDLKINRLGIAGDWARGLATSVSAPLYEFTMRHLVPGVNMAEVEKRFDQNWFDNTSVAHYVGGEALPSNELFQAGSKVNTDRNSEDFLFQEANPNAGKWNGDFSNIIGTVSNGMGALSGFGSSIGAASEVAAGLGAGKKASNLLGLSSYMYLSGYDNNKKEAKAALGDDPENESKVNWLAHLYTAADILGMELVKPAKQLENIFGKTIMGGEDLINKLSKGGIETIKSGDIAKTFANGLKASGISFTEMTGGMSAITAGRYLADMMLAPEKFKNEDTGEKFVESTVHAAVINALPALLGGFNMARHEGGMIKSALYDVGSNPRPYMDAIDAKVAAGEMDAMQGAEQKKVVSTLTEIVANSIPEVSPTNDQSLTIDQKQEYAANLFNEAVLASKKEVVKDKVQIEHIDKYVKELQARRSEILDNAGEVVEPVAPEVAEQAPEPVVLAPQPEPVVTQPESVEVVAENDMPVSELMDRPILYKGKEGTLMQDGQTVIVKMKDKSAEGREVEYELGNIDEISDHSITEYGIEQQNSVVNINEAGNLEVRGKEYLNGNSDPLAAISYDKDGNPSVSLDTPDGKKRTFRGAVGEDIAYQLTLKEIEKRNEQGKFEEFINSDEESRIFIEESKLDQPAEPDPGTITGPVENVGPEKPIEEGSATNNEPISQPAEKPARPKIERKTAEQTALTPDLFAPDNVEAEQARKKWIADNPEFDFEDEPSVVAKQKTKSKKDVTAGLFSPENKDAVTDQNKQAAAEWDAIKNNTAQPSAEPQEVVADKFFNAPRSADEGFESGKVGERVKSRFAQSEKIVGNPRVRVLPDGQKIAGRYVLADAFSMTPSHDPSKGFQSSEGFPMLEDGRNPNDRDYTQKDVSGKVLQRANKYDGQAVENVPTVDKNGIVIDGNDRTMAGQLAAKNGTDGAYKEVLKDNAVNYGFSREQVEAMEKKGMNPRLVFVPDAIESYSTDTFAKFNPRTQGKVKNSIENAITLGRTAPDELVDRLGGVMDGYETTAKFFNSTVAMKDARALLERYKIINADNVNEYFDTPSSMTANGKELLQNLMLGKTFGEPELRLLQNHKDIREKMVYSMNNILAIEALGEKYSLKSYFDETLHLWDEVERYKESNGLDTMAQAFDLFSQQGNLHGETFSPESRILFNELDSLKKSNLREFTKSYLQSARDYAVRGEDMFGNQPASKEQLINDYVELKKQREQLESELARKADAERNVGPAVGEGERPVPEGTAEPERPAETTVEGNTDTAIEGEPGEPTDRIAQEYNNPTEDIAPQMFEPMPEYGKEDTTQLPTEPEKQVVQDAYTTAVNEYNKHNSNETKVAAKIENLEDRIADMKRNRETGTEEYKKAVSDLEIQKKVKSQIALKKKAAELAVKKTEGRRLSDEIRKLKGKLASDMAFSVPGISPNMFKPLIDFVASAVKIGENVHDAILDAVIKFKERNPELKFDEDALISKLQSEIAKITPERDKSYRPQIESAKNKQAADAIIGKIKTDPSYKEEAMKKLLEHPSLQPETKRLMADYIEFYTSNEETIVRDTDNPEFLNDFKLKTSDETAKFISGATIADIFGEPPAGAQDYSIMKQADMLNDGVQMISLAKEHFGGDVMQWGPKLLQAVKEMNGADTPKKAILLATMQGSLRQEMLKNPEREGQIRKVLNATEAYWQQFIRKSSLDLVAAKLLRMYRDQNMGEVYAEKIYTEKQLREKAQVEKMLRDTKVSDKVAEEGIFRNEAEVVRELKEENERLKKELSEIPAEKKATKEKREEYRKKADELIKDSEVSSIMDDIRERLKKIKC